MWGHVYKRAESTYSCGLRESTKVNSFLINDFLIIPGEAKIEDLSQQAQIDAAKKFNAAEAPQPSEMGGTGTTGAAAPGIFSIFLQLKFNKIF